MQISKYIPFIKQKRVIIPFVCVVLLAGFLLSRFLVTHSIISPLSDQDKLSPLDAGKGGYEVFGFAPHWRLHKLNNVDFSVLTTLAYFGIEVGPDGALILEGPGYEKFKGETATELFKLAHDNNTRVVLTITQMDNDNILTFLDDPDAQQLTIDETVSMIQRRGIDGVNVDFEYVGKPPSGYKDKYSEFVRDLTHAMHEANSHSRVTVSVYASSVKYDRLYDVSSLSKNTDGIFVMAYDFAVRGSDKAMPTAPLYGHKQGKYWYDISTAIEDMLAFAPANKLILGVPYYGYDYPVENVEVNAPRLEGYYTYYWYRRRQYSQFHEYPSSTQMYSGLQKEKATLAADNVQTGWDPFGRVGYVAYQEDGIWRMVFMEDERSLGEKYDFAKSKKLAGVGMWALGFDDGRTELWDLLREKFGEKLAQNKLTRATIKKI